jgi:hypothetical protein
MSCYGLWEFVPDCFLPKICLGRKECSSGRQYKHVFTEIRGACDVGGRNTKPCSLQSDVSYSLATVVVMVWSDKGSGVEHSIILSGLRYGLRRWFDSFVNTKSIIEGKTSIRK